MINNLAVKIRFSKNENLSYELAQDQKEIKLSLEIYSLSNRKSIIRLKEMKILKVSQ